MGDGPQVNPTNFLYIFAKKTKFSLVMGLDFIHPIPAFMLSCHGLFILSRSLEARKAPHGCDEDVDCVPLL